MRKNAKNVVRKQSVNLFVICTPAHMRKNAKNVVRKQSLNLFVICTPAHMRKNAKNVVRKQSLNLFIINEVAHTVTIKARRKARRSTNLSVDWVGEKKCKQPRQLRR